MSLVVSLPRWFHYPGLLLHTEFIVTNGLIDQLGVLFLLFHSLTSLDFDSCSFSFYHLLVPHMTQPASHHWRKEKGRGEDQRRKENAKEGGRREYALLRGGQRGQRLS